MNSPATLTRRHAERRPPIAAQRGIVLFIALIVMVALSLAGIALVRSVDTTTAVVGNLAFSQASILPANVAVEEAVAVMFEKNLIADLNNHYSAENYYAFQQPGEDSRGIPDKLLTKTKALTLTKMLAGGNDNEVRYVIERMCVAAALGLPATGINCDMMAPKQAPGGTSMEEHVPLPKIPFYRLTIRVDGPQNTVSFLQTMLR